MSRLLWFFQNSGEDVQQQLSSARPPSLHVSWSGDKDGWGCHTGAQGATWARMESSVKETEVCWLIILTSSSCDSLGFIKIQSVSKKWAGTPSELWGRGRGRRGSSHPISTSNIQHYSNIFNISSHLSFASWKLLFSHFKRHNWIFV